MSNNLKKKANNWKNIILALWVLIIVVNIGKIFGVPFLQHDIALFSGEYTTQLIFFLSVFIILDILTDIVELLESILTKTNNDSQK